MASIFNILIFILNPFAGFIYNLFRPINRISYIIFILFFFYIGCSFSFHDIRVDSYRYADDFSNIVKYGNIGVLSQRILQGKLDIYDYVICSIVSLFTESARILYAIYAAIFGYFILKFYHFIGHDWGKRKDIYVWIIILSIFFLNPHMNINGVRYWTATWVFFTSFIEYFIYHKKKWILVLVLVPFIHISYLIPLCFIVISYIFLLHFGLKQIYYITIVSLVVGMLLPVDKILLLLPTDLGVFDHFEAYTNEGNVSEKQLLQHNRSMLYILFSKLPCVYVIAFLLNIKYRKIYFRDEDSFLFTFIMLMLSFLFLLDKIPSLSRFYYISYMLLIYLTFRIYKENRRPFIKITIVLIPIFFFGLLYQVFIIHDSVLSNIYLYKPTWDIIEFALSY